jgi:hypothetical protein
MATKQETGKAQLAIALSRHAKFYATPNLRHAKFTPRQFYATPILRHTKKNEALGSGQSKGF